MIGNYSVLGEAINDPSQRIGVEECHGRMSHLIEDSVMESIAQIYKERAYHESSKSCYYKNAP